MSGKRLASGGLLLLILTLPWALGGCGPSVQGLVHDPSFVYPALAQGGITAGGVVSLQETLSSEQQALYGSFMRDGFVDQRQDLTIAPMDSVVEALGLARYKSMLEGFTLMGSLAPETLGRLADSYNRTRYIAFARVEGDRLSQDRRRNESTNSLGLPEEVVTSVSTRTTTMTLKVYDLQQEREVWSGSITFSGHNSLEYRRLGTGYSQVLGLINEVAQMFQTDDEAFPYPDYPLIEDNLLNLFAQFGYSLPQAD